VPAGARHISTLSLSQLTAIWADEDIPGVPRISSQQVAGEKVYSSSAFTTLDCLYPQKVFHMRVFGPAENAARAVELSDLFF
jgi:hypothetical protein